MNFNDRTSRAGYWWVILMNVIIGAVIGSITAAVTVTAGMTAYPYDSVMGLAALAPLTGVTIVSNLWSLVNLVPGLSISVRRMHDIGKSWAWILINLIPIVGAIIFIVLAATAQKHPPENRFAYLNQV